MDSIKRQLTGRSPDYVRGFLDALKMAGQVTQQEAKTLLGWATEAAIRRIVTGPLGGPESQPDG